MEDGAGDEGVGEELDGEQEEAVDGVGDGEGGHGDRGRLADQDLLGTDRGGEERLEGSCFAFADDRVAGDRGRHDHRDEQHVEQREPDVLAQAGARDGGLPGEEGGDRKGGEDRRVDDHGADEEAVAPVLAQLLADHGGDAGAAHRSLASTSSSTSWR